MFGQRGFAAIIFVLIILVTSVVVVGGSYFIKQSFLKKPSYPASSTQPYSAPRPTPTTSILPSISPSPTPKPLISALPSSGTLPQEFSCKTDSDCVLKDKVDFDNSARGSLCCGGSQCVNASSGDIIAVNHVWFEGMTTQVCQPRVICPIAEQYCPDIADSYKHFKATCISSECQKVAQ